MRLRSIILFLTFACVCAGGATAGSTTVDITATADNTLYTSDTGNLSNGVGAHLFSGRIAAGPFVRRALVRFDLAGQVPAGATIVSATLTLYVNKTVAPTYDFDLHRVLVSWGEGSSNAPSQEGQGAAAATNDATWLHRFYPSTFWSTVGGDFDAASSATGSVGGIGPYTWGSTAGMVADVQGWVNDPSSNHGWIVIGNEQLAQSTKRFTSRHSASTSQRPRLTIEYTTMPVSAGQVPDGKLVPGAQMVIRKTGNSLRLIWDASCRPSDTDYGVYVGDLGDWGAQSPVACSSLGATFSTVPIPADDSYYLVVPSNADFEGGYGFDAGGNPRPQNGGACAVQSVDDPVCTP